MYKKVVWPLLLISALALALLFISGFVASIVISSNDDSPSTNETVENETDFPEDSGPSAEPSDVLIMGDSIGFGVGDEEELGIGARYLSLLSEEDETDTSIANLSVPGFESTQLADLVESGEHGASISSAQLIIISIGGNDLNRLEFEDNLDFTLSFDETLTIYRENLGRIISTIRSLNPDAQLALIGLYNPYTEESPELARILLEWNYETRLIANSDTRLAYIPTYEVFEYHLNDYLSFDQFHPNGAGYQVIAEQLYQVLN
ncbi:MAG: hypothetical protein JJU16_01425 [Alkalibacterium sp.]|nr:hypothetical protein [Alkalibacterium sp.]